MFVKATSGGRQLTYLQLVESYREGGRVRQRVIAKLGREDELDRDSPRRHAAADFGLPLAFGPRSPPAPLGAGRARAQPSAHTEKTPVRGVAQWRFRRRPPCR
jgi:hypothetical protein